MNHLNHDTSPAADGVSLSDATLPEKPSEAKPTLKAKDQTPLFTEAEKRAWKKKFADIKAEYKDKPDSNEQERAAEKGVAHALKAEVSNKVLERAENLVDGLLFIVGKRGAEYLRFRALFTFAKDPQVVARIEEANTPENRRELYTILRAFSEIPKSFGCTAFIKYLRGTGKPGQPKYAKHGQGMFAKEYGWTTDQVKRVCEFLMGYHYEHKPHFGSYQSVVNSYADVQDEIYKDDPDLDKDGAYKATFAATRAEKNIPLLEKMIAILEERGLGPIPTPKKTGPKKKRVPKKFKPGDKIRRGNLRDLPLPALVKVPVRKIPEDRTKGKDKEPEIVHLEWVVTALTKGGEFQCFFAGRKTTNPKDRTAALSPGWAGLETKEYLYGAEYLGPWEGRKLDPSKQAKNLKFNFCWPGRGY